MLSRYSQFCDELENYSGTNQSSQLSQIAKFGPDYVIVFYDTHFHTAEFVINRLEATGLRHRLLPVFCENPALGGVLSADTSVLADLGPFPVVVPYDPHGEIAEFARASLQASVLIDLSQDLVFPDYLQNSFQDVDFPLIKSVFQLLADDESAVVFSQILAARRFGLRSSLAASAYQCHHHREIVARKPTIVADCGAFVGDVANGFLNEFPSLQRIVCFEPFPDNAAKLNEKRAASKNFGDVVELESSGVWSDAGRTEMSGSGHGARIGQVAPDGSIPLVALDEYFRNRPVPDFIKMDIGGSERAALSGARSLLAEHGPSLAISLYHRPDDLWRIPLLISSIRPDYKFYLGHHSKMLHNSVLYCVT